MQDFPAYGPDALQQMITADFGAAPYGTAPIPGYAPGSPEELHLQQILAPTSSVALPPEELEALKWQNWANDQRFDNLGPVAQRQMAQMYHDNVLPYVANSLGRTPEDLQREFIVMNPTVGRVMGTEPTEVESRLADADTLGLTGEQRTIFAANGSIDPKSDPGYLRQQEVAKFDGRRQVVESMKASGVEMTDSEVKNYLVTGELPTVSAASGDHLGKLNAEYSFREQRIREMREEGKLAGVSEDALDGYLLTGDQAMLRPGKDAVADYNAQVTERESVLNAAEGMAGTTFSADIRAAFLATGDEKVLSPSNQIRARDEVRQLRDRDDKAIKALNTSISEIDNTMRALQNVLNTLGVKEGTEQNPEYDSAGVLPASGPLASTMRRIPIPTRAATLQGYLSTLKASAVFTKLQELRAASENGSSGLGQVTNVETYNLQNSVAALDNDSLKEEDIFKEVLALAANMNRMRQDYVRRLNVEQERYNQIYTDPNSLASRGRPPVPGGSTTPDAPTIMPVPTPAQPVEEVTTPSQPQRYRFDELGNIIE